MLKFYLIIIAFLFLAPFQVFADVVINEICWMGTETSYSNEWLELFNSSDSVVSLEAWILKAADESPGVNLSGIVPAFGFYLLERTDDYTVPNVAADQIYTGALSNEGEKLELYDNLGNLIDSVDCSQGWFAGDNQTKQTMERTAQNTWQTSQNPGGTPSAENSVPPPAPTGAGDEETQKEKPAPAETKTISKSVTYPSGIIINEILPSPEGPDSEEEWIELKNLNNQTVDISDWKIQDTIGSTKTYTFPKNTKILAQGFLLLKRPIVKITLNNSGDGLKLLHPNNEIADEINYEKAPLGQSCNRENNICIWNQVLTPGSENIIREFKSGESSSSASTLVGAEEEFSETGFRKTGEQRQLAAVSKQIQKPWSSIFIAILLALFSAVIILILKKRLKNTNSY